MDHYMKNFKLIAAAVFGICLFASMGAVYHIFSPGGALSGTWNSQNVNVGAGGSLVTGILPGANGGTSNGFFAVTGPTTSLKTFTLPNASASVLTDNAAVT